MQSELTRPYRPDVYRNLLDVFDADAIVRGSDSYEAFMEEAGDLICRHDMESRFGICLLHRHHSLRRNEIMVEERRKAGGREALVTVPRREASGTPASWAVIDGELCPLEFTTDETAQQCLTDGEVPEAFIDEFKALAQSNPLGRYLGLGIVDRAFYDDFADDDIAIEYTSGGKRASVVVPERRGTMDFEPIKTAWKFRKSDYDVVAGCVDKRECIKFCREDSSPDIGHVQRHKPDDSSLHL